MQLGVARMNGSKNCNCQDCEAMKIILRFQFNMSKENDDHVARYGDIKQALDSAIRDSLFVPTGD